MTDDGEWLTEGNAVHIPRDKNRDLFQKPAQWSAFNFRFMVACGALPGASMDAMRFYCLFRDTTVAVMLLDWLPAT